MRSGSVIHHLGSARLSDASGDTGEESDSVQMHRSATEETHGWTGPWNMKIVPEEGACSLGLVSLPVPGAPLVSRGSCHFALNCHNTCICASNIAELLQDELEHGSHGPASYTAVLDLSYNDTSGLKADWTPVKLAKPTTCCSATTVSTFCPPRLSST
ncbi:hypothetical protein DPEC_G00361970 [Dallia pectoralis]|nr:hypothetical protein DPEC_G00361970 [Dallia pectoralis]